MNVKIKQAFETITHATSEGDVGKVADVAPEIALEWIKEGYAEPVDEAGKATVAKMAEANEPAAKAAESETVSPESQASQSQSPESKPVDKLNKLELLQLCAARKIEASESETKAELLAKVK